MDDGKNSLLFAARKSQSCHKAWSESLEGVTSAVVFFVFRFGTGGFGLD